MHVDHAFLANLALILVTAGVATVVFQRFHLPVVFGYMFAGLLIGPHFTLLPLIADDVVVHTLSEIGVILLMYALGLEFSLRKLIRIAPTAGLVAVGQCTALLLIGYLVGQAFGWTTMESFFTGAIIAISSTTIIVKAFEEQGAKGRYVDLVLGVLIAEDLIAILLLALLTTTVAGPSIGVVGSTTARLALFLILFTVVGLLIIPRTIRYIVTRRRPETTLVASVGLCFACAQLALSFGYSVALGAFIGGAITAESGVARQVEHIVQPVRDMFAAIFFVAVGMLIEPSLVAANWLPVLVLTVVVIAGKLVTVAVGAFLTGHTVRTSVRSGMSLTQIGEFSFIIATAGLATGAIRPFLYPVAVAVSAITTLTTPLLIRRADRVANYVDRHLPAPIQTLVALYGSWIERTRTAPANRRALRRPFLFILLDLALIVLVIIGTSLELPSLTERLRNAFGVELQFARAAIVFIALLLVAPLCLALTRSARVFAHRLATRALPIPEWGPDYSDAPRRAFTTTVQLGIVVLAGILVIAITQPFMPPFRGLALFAVIAGLLGLAFWRSVTNLHGHAEAGAAIVAATLARALPEPELASPLDAMLTGLGNPVACTLTADAPACGRTLLELNLRGATGATVLAIHRNDQQHILPSGGEILEAGDVLALAGTPEAIAAARALILGSYGGAAGPAE